MREDTYYFSFICKKNSNARYKLMDRLLKLNELTIMETHLLHWGDTALPTELNMLSSVYSRDQKI